MNTHTYERGGTVWGEEGDQQETVGQEKSSACVKSNDTNMKMS